MQVAYLYIGLNSFIMMALAIVVVMGRGKNKVSFGDGGVKALNTAIRAHGNNTEYVPFGLIHIFALATKGASDMQLHLLGASLTAGRILHALGLIVAFPMGRMLGIILTWLMIIVGAVMVTL